VLSESGTVVAVDSDGVWVETLKQSACMQCRARHGCGQKLLVTADSRYTCIKALYPSPRPVSFPLVGEWVSIGVEESALVRAALISYGFPLVFMLLLIGVATLVTHHELALLAAAAAGLFFGGLIVRWYARIFKPNSCLQAVLLPEGAIQDVNKGT